MEKRKAAIYARYSSDLQSPRSIEDQIALCRAHAARIDVEVVAEFHDRAKSGSNIINREGILDLLHAAKAGQFEVVVVEALDRLSRDQEDLAGMYKRLRFAGVDIEAVNDGKADQIQIGVRGMLGALYLTDLANKTRRGMQGRIRDGMSAGGLAYGYSLVKGEPGVRVINEQEAEIVRRIFQEYSLGKAPRYIARDLNAEGVKPPRKGRTWNASTINGNTKRGFGILQNQMYIGKIIWNKAPMFRDPDTGRRISKPNPPEKWQTVERPDLAIISMDVWEAVQQRKQEFAKQWENKAHRPRTDHLFAGILKCGHCGSGMSLDGFRHGHRTICCSRSRESMSCDNNRRWRLDRIEEVVLDGIMTQFLDTNHADLFVKEYLSEWRELVAGVRRKVRDAEKELEEAQQCVHRLVVAVAKGLLTERDIGSEKAAYEARQRELRARIEFAHSQVPEGLDLSDGAVSRYREVVDGMRGEVREAVTVDPVAKATFRELVREIAVSAKPEAKVTVAGNLHALVGSPTPPTPESGGIGLVAGARFELTTFRL